MGKVPKNARLKNRVEICIFCGEKADSAEHIFGNVFKSELGYDQYAKNIHDVIRIDHETRTLEVFAGAMTRNGDPFSQSLKCVCTNCNNTWMQDIQARAQAALIRYAKGEWSQPSATEADAMASYTVLKTMVWEFADPQTAYVSQADRTAFMNNSGKVLPKGWMVFFAEYRSVGDWKRGFYHRALRSAASNTKYQKTVIMMDKLVLISTNPPSGERGSIEWAMYQDLFQVTAIAPRGLLRAYGPWDENKVQAFMDGNGSLDGHPIGGIP